MEKRSKMEELTPKSNGNGYEQDSKSNDESPLISQRREMLSISIPQQASFEPRKSRSWKGCIQKVPNLLRLEEHNKRDYDPAVVSLGPYHHGKPELKLAEEFKPKALQLFAAESGKDPDFLYNKVLEVIRIQDLRRCYIKNSTDEYDDAVFAQMMLLDACFIVSYIWMNLEYKDRMIKAVVNHHQIFEALINQYPIFEATIDHLGSLVFSVLFRDLFLLENQIPFCLVKLLINLKWGKNEGEEMLSKFLTISLPYKHTAEDKTEEDEPLHLLAALRRKLVANCNKDHDISSCWSVFQSQRKREITNRGRNFKTFFHTFHSVTDLKAKGIHFRPSLANSLKDIKFKSWFLYGELRLPTFIVSANTKVLFLNLVAFELCPNNVNDQTVSTYINFMKSLIESPKDVKELREKQILMNVLGSDEQVMQVYKDINTFGTNNYGMYYEVKEKIQEHYSSKAKTWAAELIHTYFSSPWTMIALISAVSFLCLTFLQTYFTIHPSPDE